ncbi:ferredoxin [Streptomyces sp. AC536]|uniref:ferredoxin n=1 Tax=Streptomyces buecherae TaxID=2763006 RepID=UPI00164D6F42|nr:ferredoxin [Streptomyces buecherae]MBC3981469.1 ferredoxin [Streptomyces buecherae]QNJ42757.1 ferredoxin [Streptomyces buecherae]
MAERWQIEVDQGRCIGSGLCVGETPDVFRLGATRRSEPIAAEVDAGERVLDAAESCPVEAITLRLGSGEPVFPPVD